MTSQWTINLVVIFLGLVTIAAMGIAGVLLLNDKSIPDMFVAMGAGALGGLTGVLVSTRSDNTVTVANTVDRPVPTDPQ